MGLIVMVQGFKLSDEKFDIFLRANGMPGTEGSRFMPDDQARLAEVCSARGIPKIKVFKPCVMGFSSPSYFFVCCDWIFALGQRELMPGDLEKPVPAAFDELRRELDASSEISRYILFDEEDSWTWVPEPLIERNTWPVACGICEAEFTYWRQRVRHRREEHHIFEPENPLPEC